MPLTDTLLFVGGHLIGYGSGADVGFALLTRDIRHTRTLLHDTVGNTWAS